MRDNAVEGLLSLFTSADRAEAIAGDLAQEREQHGWIWFWLHVARTTLALWRRAVTDAPVALLLVRWQGARSSLRRRSEGSRQSMCFHPRSVRPVGWIALSLFWWGGALWTGATLVVIAPRARDGGVRDARIGRRGTVDWFGRDHVARPAGDRLRPLLHDRPAGSGAAPDRRRPRSSPADRVPYFSWSNINESPSPGGRAPRTSAGCARVATADRVEGLIAAQDNARHRRGRCAAGSPRLGRFRPSPDPVGGPE